MSRLAETSAYERRSSPFPLHAPRKPLVTWGAPRRCVWCGWFSRLAQAALYGLVAVMWGGCMAYVVLVAVLTFVPAA